MEAMASSDSNVKADLRVRIPWWREPMALAFFGLILLASAAVVLQGHFAPPPPTDPAKRAAIPGGGTFCDTPTPVQSTAYNPSTQFSK
jgi:hypothetical protein